MGFKIRKIEKGLLSNEGAKTHRLESLLHIAFVEVMLWRFNISWFTLTT